MIRKKILCGCLILLLPFCVFAKKNKVSRVPEWITNSYANYSEEKYLVAVGSANDKVSSEMQALSALAAIFKQNINSTTETENYLYQVNNDGSYKLLSESSINQKVVQTVAVKNLVATEIKETWHEKQTGTWYALAVLEREKAIDIYSQIFIKNNEYIKKILTQKYDNSTKNTDNLSVNYDKYDINEFSRYFRALSIAQMNEGFIEKIRVLDFQASKVLENQAVSKKEIQDKCDKIASNIKIYIGFFDSGKSTQFDEVHAFVKDIITSKKFVVSDDENAQYYIFANCVLNILPSSDGKTQRCNYVFSVNFYEKEVANQLFQYICDGHKSDFSVERAQLKAINELKEKIYDDFNSQFEIFLGRITE